MRALFSITFYLFFYCQRYKHSASSSSLTAAARGARGMCVCSKHHRGLSPHLWVTVRGSVYTIDGGKFKLCVCVCVVSSKRYVLWVLHIVCSSHCLKGTAILNTLSTHTGSHTHADTDKQARTHHAPLYLQICGWQMTCKLALASAEQKNTPHVSPMRFFSFQNHRMTNSQDLGKNAVCQDLI